ncbi:hypothetical protein G4228_012319 [Cervus hanglu yarkandensis]|nr:hypothetical protein G4228_012319 [Cervus hanglu yarkandensis]
MGSRKCGSCLSSLLIPLALWSIIVNILLYFPNGQASYASSNKLTNYVWYFEGICFSGIMMLVVAAVLLILESDNNYKCCQSENCSKKYMTVLSMIFSALGITFSGYCLVISALGLLQGPYCRTLDGWEYAFEGTAGRFLTDSREWIQCLEPAHVVEWNIILFSILIVLSGLQVVVCLIRVVIQLSKTLCGTYSVIIQVTDPALASVPPRSRIQCVLLKDFLELHHFPSIPTALIFTQPLISQFFLIFQSVCWLV